METSKLTVKLSLSSCMISVLSLYESSPSVSSSAMASSKAYRIQNTFFLTAGRMTVICIWVTQVLLLYDCVYLTTEVHLVQHVLTKNKWDVNTFALHWAIYYPHEDEKSCEVLWTYSLSQLAGLIRWVDDLVVENREIQGKTKTDWVRGLHLFFADIKGILVGIFWVWNDGWEEKDMKAVKQWEKCTKIHIFNSFIQYSKRLYRRHLLACLLHTPC